MYDAGAGQMLQEIYFQSDQARRILQPSIAVPLPGEFRRSPLASLNLMIRQPMLGCNLASGWNLSHRRVLLALGEKISEP